MNDIAEVPTVETIDNPIAAAAVLVELNISVWGASRLDRAASDQVVAAAGAVDNAAQVRKDLLAGDKTRKAIADYAATCRMWHNRKTMPWNDKGARLLPTSLFLEYKTEANAMKAHFDTLVATFIAAYPQLRQDAQARMGTLFDATEYPDVAEIEAKFRFVMVFSPVPVSGDFRVKVTDDALSEMQESYANAFTERFNAVTHEPWHRLYDMLKAMSEKMTEDEGPRFRNRKNKDGEVIRQEIKRPYHESFIKNANDMVALLGHLNITNDPKLERARLDLECAIANVDIDAVRESPEVRAGIKASVDEIIAKNDGFW